MIVFAAKVSVRKIVVGVLAVGLVLVGAAALLPKTAEADTAVSAEGAALSAKLKTNEDRVALLTACGTGRHTGGADTRHLRRGI
mgnify:CR=1 FL=1